MKRNWKASIMLSLIAGAALYGCSRDGGETSGEDSKLSVVTSFYPVFEFTKQVAGDRADISLMVSGGADAHHYEPSAKDVARVNEADVFVFSSEKMEHWAESLLSTIENEELIVARTADGSEVDAATEANQGNEEESGGNEAVSDEKNNVPVTIEINGLADHYHSGDVITLAAEIDNAPDNIQWQWSTRESRDSEWEIVSGQHTDHFEYKTAGESFEVRAMLIDDKQNPIAESQPAKVLIDDHEEQDPHIWLDPVLAQQQVNVIRDALIEADPEGQAVYEKNAEAFKAELQTLHEEYEAAFEGAEDRVFVVQHQAFGYIAERYNLEQVAIGGLSTEVEPSPSRIAEIGKQVEKYEVPVIYFQQGADSAIAETVAAETGTETAVLYDLEVLTDDLQKKDLGYVEAMRKNLDSLLLSVH